MKLRQSILLAVSVLFVSVAATVASAMSDASGKHGLSSPVSIATVNASEIGGSPVTQAPAAPEHGGWLPAVAVVGVLVAGPFVRKALRA